MIKEGRYGSINIFYKDQYFLSVPKHREDQYDKFMIDANKVLMSQMKKGHTLKEIIGICESGMKMYAKRKFIHKKKLTREEYETLASIHFVLLRVNRLKKDEFILEMPKKKSPSLIR